MPMPLIQTYVKFCMIDQDKFAARALVKPGNLPGKVRMADNLGLQAHLRLFRALFSKYYFMNLLKILYLTNLPLKNVQRHHQYCSKKQNVICHMPMLSAIAQPQPLCYLPQLC